MKKTIMLLLTVICLSDAVAEDNGWGAYGTYWAPGNWDSAAGVGTKISFEVVPNALLDVSCSWFQELEDNSGMTTAKIDVMPVDIGLSFFAGTKPVNIYLTAGYSYYYIDGSLSLGGNRERDAFDDESGFYGGAGIEVPIKENQAYLGATRIAFVMEALYRYVAVEEITSSVGDIVGGEADGICVNAGFMIRW